MVWGVPQGIDRGEIVAYRANAAAIFSELKSLATKKAGFHKISSSVVSL
jgi:hypothetical protein